jgi:hypothetical protein
MLFYRFQQFLVIVFHLILLGWMFYSLMDLGNKNTTEVFLHFLGMAIYGGLLIRLTAMWAKHHYEKEQQAQ